MSFIWVNKPSGIATHAVGLPEPGAPEGFAEFLSRVSDTKLLVCHRLDKQTSGCMVFTDNKEEAARLSARFARRAVDKTYLFVTDRESSKEIFTATSLIEKQDGKFVSLPVTSEMPVDKLATTDFKKLKTEGQFTLWEASPQTGRSHQIRLHAEDHGIPILGDEAHGGSIFPTLLLHCLAMGFSDLGADHRFECAPPKYFQDLSLLENRLLCSWLAAFDRKQRWLQSLEALRPVAKPGSDLSFVPTDCWRWIHTEGASLRIDQFGVIASLQWFSDCEPSEEDWRDIETLLEFADIKEWRLHLRLDRGHDPNRESVWQSRNDLATRWIAHEHGLRYELRADSGLSAGLFLDQRANRLWLRRNSQDKTVLNLFCYTGGFSVAAARGGAAKVISVDVSKSFLEWTRRNFELNDLSVADHEFRAMDVREYLKYARKKDFKFDRIICDPPSFGRSKYGVFRLEKDLPQLIEEMGAVLAPGGSILFSCNFEKWTAEAFMDEITKAIKASRSKLKVHAAPPADWDFELPKAPRVMKCVLLS